MTAEPVRSPPPGPVSADERPQLRLIPMPDGAAADSRTTARRSGSCDSASPFPGHRTGRDPGRGSDRAMPPEGVEFGPTWSTRADLPDPTRDGSGG